jgi:3-deoxy-D-manno-octulosonate 8-phosphate phosphatase (KDO 8-P phosphatase)
MSKSYKELLKDITTFIFDVDGVLTDGTITLFGNGEMTRTMHTKDGFAMKTAIDMGFNICIISGGTSESVRIRLGKLGIKDIYLGAHNKIEQFTEYTFENDIKPENCLYMGDDIPDIPVMQKVLLPTCPNDAVREVQETAKYISNIAGGKGCVRDVIEQVLRVQGKWNSDFDAQYF